jgi:hypothetical protein
MPGLIAIISNNVRRMPRIESGSLPMRHVPLGWRKIAAARAERSRKRARFVADSSLEGNRFEISVPRRSRHRRRGLSSEAAPAPH